MKALLLIFVVFGMTTAFAAPSPAKKATLLDSTSKMSKPLSAANLKGLSLFASYDMVDTMDFNASQNGTNFSGSFNGEKALGLGGEYLVYEAGNGLAVSGGGSYELSRQQSSFKTNINNNNGPFLGSKPELAFWTIYGNAQAFLTERFSVFAGPNFNFPQVKNLNGTWKGKLGYQVGASFALTPIMAVDAELRSIKLSGSEEKGGVTTTYDDLKNEGFVVRGRFMF